ncbi:MAG: hypothetical protein ACYS9X_19300 [Planctomycetota bacterium]
MGDKHDCVQLCRDAAAGRYGTVEAHSAFTLVGMLPLCGHPFPYTYRVKEAEIRGIEMRCDLAFTGMTFPGMGPCGPTLPYFVADMPPLPEGVYGIVFRVVDSYWRKGDAAPVVDDARRDSLATTPFRATFTIGNAPAIAWGETADGLQAGIASTGDASRETPGAAVRFHLKNTGDKPARILRLGAARACWPPFPVEVKVDGRLRDYQGPVLDPPPPPSIADFIDLAPGAVDSTEVDLPLVHWGAKETSAVKVAFVYVQLLAESMATPSDPQARTWAEVKGLWTGQARSGFVAVGAGD